MKIYFAAPLFTAAEIQWNADLAEKLRRLGYEVFLPQEVHGRNAYHIFDFNLLNIDSADIIVAIVDGPDPDSGTSWELGYAYAKKKLLVAVRTDFRASKDIGEPFNLMLSISAGAIVIRHHDDKRILATSIKYAIKRLEAKKRRKRQDDT